MKKIYFIFFLICSSLMKKQFENNNPERVQEKNTGSNIKKNESEKNLYENQLKERKLTLTQYQNNPQYSALPPQNNYNNQPNNYSPNPNYDRNLGYQQNYNQSQFQNNNYSVPQNYQNFNQPNLPQNYNNQMLNQNSVQNYNPLPPQNSEFQTRAQNPEIQKKTEKSNPKKRKNKKKTKKKKKRKLFFKSIKSLGKKFLQSAGIVKKKPYKPPKKTDMYIYPADVHEPLRSIAIRRKIKYEKLICVDSVYCDNNCAELCNEMPNAFSVENTRSQKVGKKTKLPDNRCNRCKGSCEKTKESACAGKFFGPEVMAASTEFKANPKKCFFVEINCIRICKKSDCKFDLLGLTDKCMTCKKSCQTTGNAVCNEAKALVMFSEDLFAKVFMNFKNGPKIICLKCPAESGYYCGKECGADHRCLKNCADVALNACFSVCKGDGTIYYIMKFGNEIKQHVFANPSSCQKCGDLCMSQMDIDCNKLDLRCKTTVRNECNHQCLKKYCNTYKNEYDQDQKNIRKFFLKYLNEKINVICARLKAHQNLRNRYDDEVEQSVRMNVFREMRDEVYNAVLLAQDDCYSIQENNYKEERSKNLSYENGIYDKFYKLATDEKDYYNKDNKEFALFED